MRWVAGEGMRAFRMERTAKRLNWLDVGQTAAKATIMTAMKVLYKRDQEDLVEKLADRINKGS